MVLPRLVFGHVAVESATLGLFVLFVPAQAQPLEALEDRVHRGIGVALDVGVIEPKNHGSAGAPGI